MLKIFYGDMSEAMYNAEEYFNVVYEDEWITDNFVKEMIKDVDRCDVISSHLIESPVLGAISPRDLSGGVKTLILMLYDNDTIHNASSCGDNCAKWILEIAKRKDLTINLLHIMNFDENMDFEAILLNNNKKITSVREYYDVITDL